jgi:subtilisin family serine protease
VTAASAQRGELLLAGFRDDDKTDEDKLDVVVHAEFDGETARGNFERLGKAGITVFNRFHEFADAFVNQEGLQNLLKADGLRWADLGTITAVPPPPSGEGERKKVLAVPDRIVQGGVEATKGAGVIIAIVDTGVDFHHPDFVVPGAGGKPTSRFLYFWDTLAPASKDDTNDLKDRPSYPTKQPIGRVYGRGELNHELQARLDQRRILVRDTDGHGTACAGIAAGTGRAQPGGKNYAGVAPEADLIAVRIGTGPGLENAYLLNAVCGWLDQVAKREKKPLVVSCSFGGPRGGRDGFNVTDRQLSARFADDVRERAVCVAAGNDGFRPIHAKVVVRPGAEPEQVLYQSVGPGRLTLYYDSAGVGDVTVAGGDGEAYTHGLSGSHVREIEVSAGTGSVKLACGAQKPVEVDAYLIGPNAAFLSHAVSGKQITEPGTAVAAITVGSYDWNDQFDRGGRVIAVKVSTGPDQLGDLTVGQLSAYSNPGPLRKAPAVKPDLVAPGQYFAACAPENVDVVYDTSGRYQLFNGTSAATPYTAGVIALVMKRNPGITLGDLKKLLDKPNLTQAAPAYQWGRGKLDFAAVGRILDDKLPGTP